MGKTRSLSASASPQAGKAARLELIDALDQADQERADRAEFLAVRRGQLVQDFPSVRRQRDKDGMSSFFDAAS